MKIVYLILCHKNPEQVFRLIRRLNDEGVFFVIHVDKRADDRVYNLLTEFALNTPNLYMGSRCRCHWGGFGIVQATINCIHRALELNRPFDYAILISGQDYPIKSNAQIRCFLRERRGKEFIESFSLVKRNRWSDHGGMYNAVSRVQYWTFFVRSRCLHIKWRRNFPFGWQPHGGSQWWCLSNECIRYIQSFIRTHSSFVRYFKFVFIPDESFFQSVISNSQFLDKVVSDDLRYADWQNPNPNYPRTLDDEDFDQLKKTNKLFARKFEVHRSNNLLERIERELLTVR
jgi:hypothetical protein